MLEREKIGCRLHFTAIQSEGKWLSLQRSIGQVGYQSCKESNDDISRSLSNQGSKLAGEQTLLMSSHWEEERMKGKLKCLVKRERMAWESKGNGVEKGREKSALNKVQWLEIERSIELKRFLHTDFTTKNCFRALNPRLGYRFNHLIKIKTYLNTTLIGLK